MNRVIVSGLALLTAASLAACQQTPASDKAAAELKAEKDKTAALELRIAELEKKAAETPALGTNLQAPATAPAAAPIVLEQRTVRRSTAPKKTTPTRSASSRVSVIPDEGERVEEPTARTTSGSGERERDPWAATGDPGPRREEIPAGTSLTLVLETPLSTETSHEGQSVTARVERATSEDGDVVLPGGSVLRGRVTEVDRAGRVSGPRLELILGRRDALGSQIHFR